MVRQVLKAELTWTGEKFERGVAIVVENGEIVSLEKDEGGERDLKRAKTSQDEETVVVEMSGEAILPGLVNCHSHAFQRSLRGLGEEYDLESKDSFWTWRQEMYDLVSRMDQTSFYEATKECFAEMKAAGITCVGEFHYFHHCGTDPFALDLQVIKAAEDTGIRLVLLNAFYCYGGFEQMPLNEAQKRFQTTSVESFWTHMDSLAEQVKDKPLVSLGVVAHSLRAVSEQQLIQLHSEAQKRSLPFHLHIEEQPKEVEDCKRANAGRTPMRVLLDSIQSAHLTTAVHCNHTVVDELREFVSKGGSVCICPLTEGNLGDGVMTEFGACASSVCVGTDCNARIDLLEEMRWLEYSQRLARLERGVCPKASARGQKRCSSGKELLKIATENGAKSLGCKVGRISPGYLADFTAVKLDKSVLQMHGSTTPLEEKLAAALVFGCSAAQVVSRTCVGGVWTVLDANA